MIVVEDYHRTTPQGPFVTDVRCGNCDGTSGGLRLIDGTFYHRDPADCAARTARARFRVRR